MRESIINAFCHRDYHDPDYVQVAVFKDRLEIRNPGGLFAGLTIEELRKGNVSKRRNPLVAELLRRVHMVEAWGHGVPLILEKEPGVEFKEVAKLFITRFDRPSFKETTDKGAATPIGKSMSPKEIPKKPQRTDPCRHQRAPFPQHQGGGVTMQDERLQCSTSRQPA